MTGRTCPAPRRYAAEEGEGGREGEEGGGEVEEGGGEEGEGRGGRE